MEGRETMERTRKAGRTAGRGRNPNIELFRIVTMFLIVLHHYVVNSGLTEAGGPVFSAPLSWRSLALLLLGAWGKTGINCFVLITGYFLCTSGVTVRKYVRLLGVILFYRLAAWLAFGLAGYDALSLRSLALTLLPVSRVGTDFSSCYLLFYPLIPFLNLLIRRMSGKQHLYLLGLCLFIFAGFGTVHRIDMNYVTWFCTVYLLGAWLALHPGRHDGDARFWGTAAAACVLLSAASVIACTWLGARRGSILSYYFVTDANSLLPVGTAVSLFMLFRCFRPRGGRLINAVAASTFGVFCLHTCSDTMKRWLWRDLLDNTGHYASPLLLLHALGSAAAVFAVCTLIDFARIRLAEKPALRCWDRLWPRAGERFAALDRRIAGRLEADQTHAARAGQGGGNDP